MEVILAKSAGFCFGVRRATQMAFEAASEHETICSLGPVIHSPQVVKGLAEQGVKVVDKVEDIPPGSVIIRSHGISSEEMAKIHEKDQHDGADRVQASLDVGVQQRLGRIVILHRNPCHLRVHRCELFHKAALRLQLPYVLFRVDLQDELP